MVQLLKLAVFACALGVISAAEDPDTSPSSGSEKATVRGPDKSLPRVPTVPKAAKIKSHPRYMNLYGPPAPIEPVCNYQTLQNNPNDAHNACTNECRDISFVTDNAKEKYPDYTAVEKLYSQCHGFHDGQCKLLPKNAIYNKLTYCLCEGFKKETYEPFSKTSRACRILIAATRIVNNAGIMYNDYRDWHRDYRYRLEKGRVKAAKKQKAADKKAKLTKTLSSSSSSSWPSSSSQSSND